MNFSSSELDLVMRGLFALQSRRPEEFRPIQDLINKINGTVFEVQEHKVVADGGGVA